MSSTIRQMVAMGAPLGIVDGDIYLDMDDLYDVEDDVISIGDISMTLGLHSCLERNMALMIGPDMCHTRHIRGHTRGTHEGVPIEGDLIWTERCTICMVGNLDRVAYRAGFHTVEQ